VCVHKYIAYFIMHYNIESLHLGPVARKPISVSPGLNVNQEFQLSLWKVKLETEVRKPLPWLVTQLDSKPALIRNNRAVNKHILSEKRKREVNFLVHGNNKT